MIEKNQKHRAGVIWMLVMTAAIIMISIILVRLLGQAAENRLLSQSLPLSETIEIAGGYLQIEYPWEVSDNDLQEASENEIKQFRESEYTGQLEKLAAVLSDSVVLDTENLWIDKEGRLIHKGAAENELSYAVDMQSGIVGFGLKGQKETDEAAKKEKLDQLMASLSDPMQALYQFLPAVNDIWTSEGTAILDALQADQEQSLGSIYDVINALPRQVLHDHDVLTVILQIEESYMILQYDPSDQKYSSCFLIRN